MILDIFSNFDPFINLSFSVFPFFWILIIFRLFIIRSTYWMCYNYFSWILAYPLDIINTQSVRTLCRHIKGFSGIVVPLFVIFILTNFIGLLPYSFSYSSHIVFSLIFGLLLWLSLVISRFFNSPSTFTAGLLPRGAPDWLNPFLVFVETVSIIVRPITLSVRLVANIRAGHIVLILIGIYGSSYLFISIFRFMPLLFIQIGYIVFEIGICLIQAYIFCLLLTLYGDDHTH